MHVKSNILDAINSEEQLEKRLKNNKEILSQLWKLCKDLVSEKQQKEASKRI